MERVVGTPVPFDAKIAKWLRSALSKDNERPYLQWAHIERQSNGTTYVFATDGTAMHGVIVQDDTFPSGHAVRIDKAGTEPRRRRLLRSWRSVHSSPKRMKLRMAVGAV